MAFRKCVIHSAKKGVKYCNNQAKDKLNKCQKTINFLKYNYK